MNREAAFKIKLLVPMQKLKDQLKATAPALWSEDSKWKPPRKHFHFYLCANSQ